MGSSFPLTPPGSVMEAPWHLCTHRPAVAAPWQQQQQQEVAVRSSRGHRPLETWPAPLITAKELKWRYGFSDFSRKSPKLPPSSSPCTRAGKILPIFPCFSHHYTTWSLYQSGFPMEFSQSQRDVAKATGNPWCTSCCNHSANLSICFKDISRGEKWLYFIVKRQCHRQLISTIYFISSKPKYWYIWTNSVQGKSTFPKHSWTQAADHKL